MANRMLDIDGAKAMSTRRRTLLVKLERTTTWSISLIHKALSRWALVDGMMLADRLMRDSGDRAHPLGFGQCVVQ